MSFISSVTEYFWPSSQPAKQETDDSLHHEWTVTASDPQEKIPLLDFDSDYKIPNTDANPFTEVSPNRGVILSADEYTPFVTNAGSDLLIQMRVLNEKGSVSHFGLVLLTHDAEAFKTTLNNLIDQSEGKIEIFIGGGRQALDKTYQAVRRYIESVQAKDKRVELSDDCFTIANQARKHIGKAGFDVQGNPFLYLVN